MNIRIGCVAVLVTMAWGVFEPAQATKVGDTEEIAALRNKYIKAVQSNSPEVVGSLVTDDFVMLQPNPEGPDTYGKTAYVAYRKSLEPVVKLSVEPIRVLTCGDDWAFEFGEESLEVRSPEGEHSVVNRYFRILNRQPEKGWQYARMSTAAAKDLGSQKPPPLRDS